MRRVLFAFLISVVGGGGWLLGQTFPIPDPNAVPQRVLSGPDVGIRIEGTSGGRVFGTLVVRSKDGQWTEVSLGKPGTLPLTENR